MATKVTQCHHNRRILHHNPIVTSHYVGTPTANIAPSIPNSDETPHPMTQVARINGSKLRPRSHPRLYLNLNQKSKTPSAQPRPQTAVGGAEEKKERYKSNSLHVSKLGRHPHDGIVKGRPRRGTGNSAGPRQGPGRRDAELSRALRVGWYRPSTGEEGA